MAKKRAKKTAAKKKTTKKRTVRKARRVGRPRGKKTGKKRGRPAGRKSRRTAVASITLPKSTTKELAFWSDMVVFINKNKGKTFVVQLDGVNYALCAS